MLTALARSFNQLGDPALRSVLVRGLLATAVLLVALVVLIAWGLTGIGTTGLDWLDTVLEFLGVLAAALAAIALFPAAAGLVISLFLDDVADAVEGRYYRGLPPARALGFLRPLLIATRFLAVILLANILALVLVYFIPVLNVAAFLIINGLLLGREFFDLVALRRLSDEQTAVVRRANRGRIFAAGVLIAALFSVPILNILAPIVGTAFMVHIFQMVVADH